VIQYRVIDTIIGATIAVVANYLLLPSWEVDVQKTNTCEHFKMNNIF
jgi:uncharacterized membrane protein YccC